MKAKECKDWVVANKARTALGVVLAVVGVVVLPVKFVAWAEAQTATQINEERLRQEGRDGVIHSAQNAKHNYDFYQIRAAQAERELIALEEDVDAGEILTSTEKRKMTRLEEQLKEFQNKQDEALEQLSEPE